MRVKVAAALGSFMLLVGVAAPSSALTETTPPPKPTTMTALGDSITIAYDIKSLLAADPAYSWATGTQSAVSSVAARLGVAPTLRKNEAKSGAKAVDLLTQANAVKAGTPTSTELVTVLIGANDACTKTEAGMTAVETFRAQIGLALDALVAKGIDRIAVASIPNIKGLWEVGKVSSSARFIWSVYGICQSMLKNPTSTLQADVTRRANVLQRVVDFNTALRNECARITSTAPATSCRFDDDAVFKTTFTLRDVSTVDYFHPSVSGQALLAAKAYPAFGY
jgi:lysophospholipase L1-like esterase